MYSQRRLCFRALVIGELGPAPRRGTSVRGMIAGAGEAWRGVTRRLRRRRAGSPGKPPGSPGWQPAVRHSPQTGAAISGQPQQAQAGRAAGGLQLVSADFFGRIASPANRALAGSPGRSPAWLTRRVAAVAGKAAKSMTLAGGRFVARPGVAGLMLASGSG